MIVINGRLVAPLQLDVIQHCAATLPVLHKTDHAGDNEIRRFNVKMIVFKPQLICMDKNSVF